LFRSIETILGIVIVIGAGAVVYDVLAGSRGLDLNYFASNWLRYVRAVQVNLLATSIAFFIGMGIGFFAGWARTARVVPVRRILSDFRQAERQGAAGGTVALTATILWSGLRHYLRRIADAYVEAVRGTPLFVQIIFAYAVATTFYPRLDGVEFFAGVVALTTNTGA